MNNKASNVLTKLGIFGFLLAAAMPVSADEIIVLDTWNVDDIQDSGDIVEVVIGVNTADDTTVTFQWQEGDTGDALWTAIGLDIIFYNSAVEVVAVLDQDGTDVTADWSLNFGGGTGGGGFGSFLSKKNLEGGGNGGIAPDSIMLVFDGVAVFADNGPPTNATFDVHIRYGNDCSGWVSDGNTTSDTGEASGCGSTTVAEPATLALLGLGLVGLGLSRRRKAKIILTTS